jgi:structural maintenance of chromosome 2
MALKDYEASLNRATQRWTTLGAELKQAKEAKSRIETALKKNSDNRKSDDERLREVRVELDQSSGDVKRAQKLRTTAVTNLEGLAHDAIALEEKSKQASALVAQLQSELSKIDSKREQKRQQHEEIDSQLKERKRALAQADNELRTVRELVDQLIEEVASSEAQERRLRERLEGAETERSTAGKELDRLKKQNPWIRDEEQYFGSRNSEYALDEDKVKQVAREIHDLEEKNRSLSKNLNKRADTALETLEQQYRKLIGDKEKVEKDRDTIEDVIRKLDEKKNATIQKTYEKVNKDFASIFKTLLPGACAKLQPEQGSTIFEGLEVKVGFGSTEASLLWKDSLTELSGGQRSLLALSLILAMLLFKPAPMYILDEIDSALDLSHTQNIGQMLRSHFGQSQFIIVSLKEGMFNNANVLFKTRFTDGVSCVDRIEYQGRNH